MTEDEWIGCTDPARMLEFLHGNASDRKLRLFAVESARLASEWLVHPTSKAAIEAGEQVAEGASGPGILAPAYRAVWDSLSFVPGNDLQITAARAAGRTVEEQAHEAAELTTNEIVELYAEKNMEKVASEEEKDRGYWIGKTRGKSQLAAFLRDIFGNPFRRISFNRVWMTSNVVALATAIYAERDFDRLLVMADALERCGCNDVEILNHCRQPRPHVRGCWVLDLILGKS